MNDRRPTGGPSELDYHARQVDVKWMNDLNQCFVLSLLGPVRHLSGCRMSAVVGWPGFRGLLARDAAEHLRAVDYEADVALISDWWQRSLSCYSQTLSSYDVLRFYHYKGSELGEEVAPVTLTCHTHEGHMRFGNPSFDIPEPMPSDAMQSIRDLLDSQSMETALSGDDSHAILLSDLCFVVVELLQQTDRLVCPSHHEWHVYLQVDDEGYYLGTLCEHAFRLDRVDLVSSSDAIVDVGGEVAKLFAQIESQHSGDLPRDILQELPSGERAIYLAGLLTIRGQSLYRFLYRDSGDCARDAIDYLEKIGRHSV